MALPENDSYDRYHTYFCVHCKDFIIGDSLLLLVLRVNMHIEQKHPVDYAAWTATELVKSRQYTEPTLPKPHADKWGNKAGADALVVLVKGGSAEWGGAKSPVITQADREMLAAAKVKW